MPKQHKVYCLVALNQKTSSQNLPLIQFGSTYWFIGKTLESFFRQKKMLKHLTFPQNVVPCIVFFNIPCLMSPMVHKPRFSLACLLFTVFLCGSLSLRAQDFDIYDNLEDLQARIDRAGDTTLLLNFWATWCKPCVEELPCFDELKDYYGAQNVQIVLISLDFKSQLEKKFIPFLKNQQLKSEVALMADQDLDTWIPMIHDEWDGAIPATLLLKGKKRRFMLGKFENFEDLETFVRPFVTDSAAVLNGPRMNCDDLTGGKK